MTSIITPLLPFLRKDLGLRERSLIRKLRVRARGRMDGRRNVPASGETRLSTTEEAIVGAFSNASNQIRQVWAGRCRQQAQEIRHYNFSAKETDYEAPIANAKVALANVKQDLHADMVQARVRERDQLGALRAFQEQHELERDAKYPEVPLLAFSLLVGIALVEAILNANLFAEVSDWGLLGGAAAALGMSLPNVLGGCLIGFFGVRGASHVNAVVKVLGWALAILGTAALLFYNFYLAHYRALLSTSPQSEFFSAWDQVFANPMGFMAARQSMILLLLGLIAAALSVWKGVDGFTDPYPGYAAIDKKHRRALLAYEQAKKTYRGSVRAVTDKAAQQIRTALQGVDQKQAAIEQVLRAATFDLKAIESALVRSANACRTALNVYRQQNAAVRRTPKPLHFDRSLDFGFEAPELGQLLVLRAATAAEADRLHKASSVAVSELHRFAEEETQQMEAQITAAERLAEQYRVANTARAMKAGLFDRDAYKPA